MEFRKTTGLNRDVIKYAAMFTMLLNHISHVFLDLESPLGIMLIDIGYFTAITMCFFLTEGYSYTKSKKQYGLRLMAFAVISQIPFKLAFQSNRFNMLFTLLLCFLILLTMEKVKKPALKILAIACLIILSTVCDWSWKAPLFTILFAKCKGSKKKLVMAFGISWLVQFLYGLTYTSPMLSLFSSMGLILSGAVILCFYSGKRAEWGQKFSKWFFYLFYPTHLLILWFIHYLIAEIIQKY